MGLFDDLKGAVVQAAEGATHQMLGGAIDQMSEGGLQGLLGRLSAGGLGEQVASWTGPDGHLPVSADQIQAVLGQAHLDQLASSVGLSGDKIAELLSEHLPAIAAAREQG